MWINKAPDINVANEMISLLSVNRLVGEKGEKEEV